MAHHVEAAARVVTAGGWAAASMGVASIVPIGVNWMERGVVSVLGWAIVAVGVLMIVGGAAATVAGWRRRGTPMPSGVRLAATALVLLLMFLALELSDRLVRQDGRVFYWTTFLFPPTLLLYAGLTAAHRWAWRTTQAAAALGVLWFLGFAVIIPFAKLQAHGVDTPWYGRIYMIAVTLLFAAAAAATFRSLSRSDTRNYFDPN